MIPHILKVRGRWICFSDSGGAVGSNPSEAYRAWDELRRERYVDSIYRSGRK